MKPDRDANPRYPDELPSWTLKEIRDQLPARLHRRHTLKSVGYVARGVGLAIAFSGIALQVDSYFRSPEAATYLGATLTMCGRVATWAAYMWFQGLVFTGFWVLGHECGHSTLSDSKTLCDVMGYIMHSFLFAPYFSWRVSHNRHHSYHGSMEKDELFVPPTRSELGIPADADEHYFADLVEDTPIYVLLTLLRQQIFGFHAYLVFNVSGQKGMPRPTNHFDPTSTIFKDYHFWDVILSDLGVLAAGILLAHAVHAYGWAAVLRLYVAPWAAANHWIVMITFTQHTDPALPHFRAPAWTFPRGASATIDRDFLGWQGRFFLYDVGHFHVVHHFFPKIPFYHAEEATEYLKDAIGPYYMRSSKPVFRTLWDNYKACLFVDDEGDVVFYRNGKGKTIRDVDFDGDRK